LDRLHIELKEDTYQPAVIYDRVGAGALSGGYRTFPSSTNAISVIFCSFQRNHL